MSIENRPSTPKDRSEQFHIPNPPDYAPRTPETDKPKSRRRAMVGIGAVAGAAGLVAAGFGFGLGHSNAGAEKTPSRAPSASAPEVPGATAPSPEASQTEEHNTLNRETFTYLDANGKEYAGEEAFIKSIEIPASEYDGSNIDELPGELMAKLSDWVASGANEQTAEAGEGYTSADGTLKGAKAIAADFYDDAYTKALARNMPSDELNNMIRTGHQNYLDIAAETDSTTSHYSGKYKLLGMESWSPTEDGFAFLRVKSQYIDNRTDQYDDSFAVADIAITTGTGTDGRSVIQIKNWE